MSTTRGSSAGGGVRYVRGARPANRRSGLFKGLLVIVQAAFLGTGLLVAPLVYLIGLDETERRTAVTAAAACLT